MSSFFEKPKHATSRYLDIAGNVLKHMHKIALPFYLLLSMYCLNIYVRNFLFYLKVRGPDVSSPKHVSLHPVSSSDVRHIFF